ncbi:hypothetical protein SANTM175S_03958 [Streptomyces antimycoticus]
MAKCGSFSTASRQFSSVTPKWSSICSERRKPGETLTAVPSNSFSSSASPKAIRIGAFLARSSKRFSR